MQATRHAQREAAHAAEELAQSQLELSQSREAEQRALDAESSLDREGATLRETLGKHSLFALTLLLSSCARWTGFPSSASYSTHGLTASRIVPQMKDAAVN